MESVTELFAYGTLKATYDVKIISPLKRKLNKIIGCILAEIFVIILSKYIFEIEITGKIYSFYSIMTLLHFAYTSNMFLRKKFKIVSYIYSFTKIIILFFYEENSHYHTFIFIGTDLLMLIFIIRQIWINKFYIKSTNFLIEKAGNKEIKNRIYIYALLWIFTFLI